MQTPLVRVLEHLSKRGHDNMFSATRSASQWFCYTLLVVACTVTTMTGCRSSGTSWPNMAWWNSHEQDDDASVVADSKSPQLPQLPSSSATPTTPSGLASKTTPPPKSPSSATINAGGSLPDSSGAIPASYPTTPYPAIPAIHAVSQAAIQTTPNRATAPATDGASPAGQSMGVPVQTGPYTSNVAPRPSSSSQIPPREVPGSTPAASNSPLSSDTAPAYRTADTRSAAPGLANATADPKTSLYPDSNVGDRYAAPTTPSAPYSQPSATAAPQDDTNSLGGTAAAATPPPGPDQDNRYGAAGGDRYSAAEADRYASRPAGQMTPQFHPPQMPPEAETTTGNPPGTPPASGINPAATPSTRAAAPAAKPSLFRPGGTGNYRSPPVFTPPPATAIGGGMPAPTSPPAVGGPAAATGYPPPQTGTPAIGYPQTNYSPSLPPATSSVAPPPTGTRFGAPIAPPAGYPSFSAPYNPGSTAGSGTRN